MSPLGRFALATAIALGSVPVPAQMAPPKGTTPQAPVPPAADGALSLRVYGAFNEKRPLPGTPGSDNAAYAVDVREVLTRCADGSTVLTALVIGGQLTVLNNRCPVDVGKSPGGPTPACDANSWTCTTGGTPPAN
jgi:hypothetical protein